MFFRNPIQNCQQRILCILPSIMVLMIVALAMLACIKKMNQINQIYFDFTNASTKYAEKNNVPITPQKLDGESSHWFVGAITVQCPDGNNLPISEHEFEKTSPPDIKEDDFDDYEDDAQLVLISLNQETGEGMVQESIYKERLEKSDTGLPLVK